MKLSLLGWCAILGLAAGLLGPAQASMRCGTELIDTGALLEDVLKYCGEPQQRSLEEPVDEHGYLIRGAVAVEQWRYGPDNGMYRYLRFLDGRLVEIRARRY
ncbi:DUF2845 domain-containing protein [Pseudomonas sp. MYb185]|uniref:DUF2845 domain-containing protein n=1 Tax=Pseudomonas sp. MYb185 TaxID=1848729 RepID=UPI000CFB4362|nr:DUF2845 domain-containing protein [Pseudomonas sp. MYb185]PRB82826.1 hypothetical protein CQ007_05895 [Pseudomonas sp. MYb185]